LTRSNLRGCIFENVNLKNYNFKSAQGADLIDLAGNTLQEVTLPNGEVVDRQMWE
jgi:uncharacterized protein YjbI with pentapeptide repeats